MTFKPKIEVGDVVSNQELRNLFSCGNMGGMRRSNTTNTLVIVSDPFKALYEDRWAGDVLYYTGEGPTGDQKLKWRQNRTLSESESNDVSVHLFEVVTPTEYTYRGRVVLCDSPFQEEQPDDNGDLRKVWIFPVKCEDAIPVIEQKQQQKKREKLERKTKKLSDAELAARAKGRKKAGKRKTTSDQYDRSPYVVEQALRRAHGTCELCSESAPFNKPNGDPFLEVHHIHHLADDGDDIISNAAALCPNCHRKMHSLGLPRDINILLAAAS